MAQPFLGEIVLLACEFAPMNYMLCQGQWLDTTQHGSLWNLIGDVYGGARESEFALPDLRGRVAIGQGQGPALPNYPIGKSGGAEEVFITEAHLAAHSHAVVIAATATSNRPAADTILANEALSVQNGAFAYAPFSAAA